MHAQFFSFSSFQFERGLFYNITELIGRDLWLIKDLENDVMTVQFVLLFLSRAIF